MDTYNLTRIFGALCASLLLYLLVTFSVESIFETGGLESPAYAIAIEEAESAGEDAGEAVVSLSELIATADPTKGAKVFKKCAACHQAENAEKHGVGPALWGVLGREIAALGGFDYSDVLLGKGTAWDWSSLDAFIAKPKDWAPGTKMNFAGVRKPGDRAALLLWLNQQSDAPQPLPE